MLRNLHSLQVLLTNPGALSDHSNFLDGEDINSDALCIDLGVNLIDFLFGRIYLRL